MDLLERREARTSAPKGMITYHLVTMQKADNIDLSQR